VTISDKPSIAEVKSQSTGGISKLVTSATSLEELGIEPVSKKYLFKQADSVRKQANPLNRKSKDKGKDKAEDQEKVQSTEQEKDKKEKGSKKKKRSSSDKERKRSSK